MIKGKLTVEFEVSRTFDLAQMTDHWTQHDLDALLDADHEEHDEAKEALVADAASRMLAPGACDDVFTNKVFLEVEK